LVSMVLIWNAVVLEHRSLVTDPDRRRLVADPRTRGLVRLVSLAGAAVLVAGTVVTGAGPHAGDDRAARLPFLVRDVARVHSITAIGLLALVAYTGHRLDRADHQGAELRARTLRIGGLLVVQGAVGYTQYLTGVPVLLVGVHLALASLTWIEIVRLHLAIRVDMSPSVADVGSRPLATT
ncbi:MAG: heme A synthase, partial [Acidimicrobiales bacterium]